MRPAQELKGEREEDGGLMDGKLKKRRGRREGRGGLDSHGQESVWG